MIRCPHDVDDVTQEAFLRYLDRDPPLPLIEEMAPFLEGIARRVAFERYRTKRRDTDRAKLERGFRDAGDGTAVRVDDALDFELMNDQLLDAMTQLPQAHQRLLSAIRQQDVPFHESAAALGIPLSTAKAMRRQAYDRLSDLLGVSQHKEDFK